MKESERRMELKDKRPDGRKEGKEKRDEKTV